nr:uncharacterized protein LOC106682975 isoform X2 [Halyomorpha halys]
MDFSPRYELPYSVHWSPYSMSVEPPKQFPSSFEPRSMPIAPPAPYFQATSPTTVRKEIDDLARKQEEFILRCQYPKRILPSELKADGKKNYYSERRERSGSPNESRRKSGRQSYSRYSPSCRGRRQGERGDSLLSPRLGPRSPSPSAPSSRIK